MRINIRNRQRVCSFDVKALRHLLRELAEMARALDPSTEPWREITLHLLDDAGIAEVNAAIMGHDGPTDVITQRYSSIPGEPPGMCAELFVNVACALREGQRRSGWCTDHELALYLAHGCDHLTGADDSTPRERARMRRRELAWLRGVTLTPLQRNTTL